MKLPSKEKKMKFTWTNKSKNFYYRFGPIFGSRKIEAEIKDRIFDDDDKKWNVYFKRERMVAFISIVGNKIKNAYCTDNKALIELLKAEYKKISICILPKVYIEEYKKAGYEIIDEVGKNFLKIKGGYNEENNIPSNGSKNDTNE